MKNRPDKTEHIDAIFGTYGGKKRFSVKHPEAKKALIVAAPNSDAAIVAAAEYLGKRWTKYTFYAYCEVTAV